MDIIDKKNIYPVGNSLLIDVPDAAKETVSGVLLANKEDGGIPMTGTIVKTPYQPWYKKLMKHSPYRVGQQVMFRRYSLDELKITDKQGEKRFYILDQDNVLSIIQ